MCIFRKGHINLGKFQKSFLRLDDTDFQVMEMGKKVQDSNPVWAHRERAKIAMARGNVQFGHVL